MSGGWVNSSAAPANVPDYELSEEFLQPALKWSWKYGLYSSLFLVVVWPLFFSFPWGVMPKSVYSLWVSIAFAWGWLGAIYIVSAPIMEYWPHIKAGIKGQKAVSTTEIKEKESSTEVAAA